VQGQTEKSTSSCNHQRAIDLIQLQVLKAKYIDDVPARIKILTQAADLLWVSDQVSSRAIYDNAYALAVEYHHTPRAKSYEDKETGAIVLLADQRDVVIKSIAQHDHTWANSLREVWKKEESKEKEKLSPQLPNAKPTNPEVGTISFAITLIPTNKGYAIDLARTTLNYPPSRGFPTFLFKLAEYDSIAADNLWIEAISRYSPNYLEGLFYLSLYPFALDRIPYLPLSYAAFELPKSFKVNPKLQEIFLQTIFSQAEKLINDPNQPQDAVRGSSSQASLYAFLRSLNPTIAKYQKTYAERAAALTFQLEQKLTPASHTEIRQKEQSIANKSYEELVEEFENGGNIAVRDLALLYAIFKAPASEDIVRLQNLAEKISDLTVQGQVLDWLVFNDIQKKAKAGRTNEALALLNKIHRLDLKAQAMLSTITNIGSQQNNPIEAKRVMIEILNEVVVLALRSEETNEKARALLGAAYLLIKLDLARALEVIEASIATINKIQTPNLTSQYISHLIKGPNNFSYHARYQMTGYDINSVFKELGGKDFDNALLLADYISHAHLRSTVILSLSSLCLGKKLEDKSLSTPLPSARENDKSKVKRNQN